MVGLVTKPGVFNYPVGVKYNLMQALAFAGGVNDLAAPSFVKVYRQGTEGNLLAATFSIKGTDLTSASNVTIKPGDVVAVEHTFGTRTRLLLAEILRVTTGVQMVYEVDNGSDD